MSRIAEKKAQQAKALEERQAASVAERKLIAEHFSGERGMKVLEILFRRNGVLTPRFQCVDGREPNALRAARRDGVADTPLFIVECLKANGVTSITFPL